MALWNTTNKFIFTSYIYNLIEKYSWRCIILRVWHLIVRLHTIAILSFSFKGWVVKQACYFPSSLAPLISPTWQLPVHSHQWYITQDSWLTEEIKKSTCLLECFHGQGVHMTRVRKVLPGPQSFLHYQEALEEREVCMFLPPTCALLGGTSGRRDTCNSPSTLFLTFLYDCFQSVAIIFSDRLLHEKLPILYLPTGEAKNKYNIINEWERNQNS